jgi:hypothetical protein
MLPLQILFLWRLSVLKLIQNRGLWIDNTGFECKIGDISDVYEILEQPVLNHEKPTGFYSTLFLVPKKNDKMRPVINLKPLNGYLKKTHFKMDTLSKVLNIVKTGDWVCEDSLCWSWSETEDFELITLVLNAKSEIFPMCMKYWNM